MHSEVRMMNYRLQLSPQSSTHDALPLHDWRSALPANWEDARFFRSWLVCDTRVRPGLELPRINWYKVLGLTLATAVSGGVWAGIVLMIAHFWK
jgi:hypothetical protein